MGILRGRMDREKRLFIIIAYTTTSYINMCYLQLYTVNHVVVAMPIMLVTSTDAVGGRRAVGHRLEDIHFARVIFLKGKEQMF